MENEALVLQIKTGENSEEAMEQLFLQNRGFIYGIAKKYAAYADIDDLMQESYFGLLKAVEGFEPEQGNKFTTFLFPCLNRTFQRYISDTKNTKRIPEYLRIRIAKYKNFLAECSANGKEAADSEICAALGISEGQLSNLRKAIHESECISTSDFVTGTDDITVESILADPVDLEEQVTEAVAQEQLAAQLWKIVDELGGKQSEVISERYRYSKTLEEIAEQMGLSYERIRQIEKKALEILHQKEKLQNIAECYGYLESSKAYKGGLRSFKEHGGSIVEYLALKNVERAEHEQSKQENIDKLFEDILSLATN
ncbi:MAG: sigma-70 family RNA polymerase sigma factor [Oscillospiraceae bacterium]|nr:sigma-70 family RNA polymerase sigma factor [Oscillospiraceae bacterium]